VVGVWETVMTALLSNRNGNINFGRRAIGTMLACVALLGGTSCAQRHEAQPRGRVFATPEDGVKALAAAVKAGKIDEVTAIFGPDSQELVDNSDPAVARQNREIFSVAMKEQWHLADAANNSKTLVIGNEQWPFPIPLVKDADGWRFDTAAGKEEIVSRRIGRNELAAIQICKTYVSAQQLYAAHAHDGHPAKVYAQFFKSDEGRQNGLYWPAAHGQRPSPLGDLVASAAAEGTSLGQGAQPTPFHGYYFKILKAQGPSAPGGEKDYVANGMMSGGFALVAWPAQYDATGVMTFIVNQDGSVREKDLGPGTDAAVKAMARYDPDSSWEIAK
jgi:Protein of unknown function (DUF2950)